MRRYISNDQDWEQVNDEDCWGVNYTEPTAQIKWKIETILHIWGEEQPETEQDEITRLIPEKRKVFGATCVKRSQNSSRNEPGE